MMKIPLPLGHNEVEAVSRRARDRWIQRDSTAVAEASRAGSIRVPSLRSPSPTGETVYAGSQGRQVPNGYHPPSQVNVSANIALAGRQALDHRIKCSECHEWIVGQRYQCANCTSEPEAFNLVRPSPDVSGSSLFTDVCTVLDLRSQIFPSPRSPSRLLQVGQTGQLSLDLSRSPSALVVQIKSWRGATVGDSRSERSDGLSQACHTSRNVVRYPFRPDQRCLVQVCTLCRWIRRMSGCRAECKSRSEPRLVHRSIRITLGADHPSVFVVFKARVNMNAFRQLAKLEEAQSEPLLKQQAYMS